MAEVHTLSLEEKIRDAYLKYYAHGWARIPDVFSEAICLQIKSNAEIGKRAAPERMQFVTNSHGDKYPALLFWPQEICQPLWEISHSKDLRMIVEAFLHTDKIRHLNNQIYFREPGDEDEFAWHQDLTFRTPAEEFYDIESGYLQTVIVVDEIFEDNSPIEFISGSQNWGDMKLVPRDNTERNLRKFVRGTWKGTKVLAKPGDVLVWSVMTVHGSEENTSDKPRMLYMNGFARDDACKNKERFGLY